MFYLCELTEKHFLLGCRRQIANLKIKLIMKRILAAILLLFGFGSAAFALGPVPAYQWDFNLTNNAAGTNYIYSARPGGNLQGSAATTDEGILVMNDVNGALTDLLGQPGSGVGTNIFDRAVLLNGSIGAAGPIIRTPALANTLTNLGVLTNFTVTAWIKVEGSFTDGKFPRVLMFGQQNLDTGSLINNVTFLQFNNAGFGVSQSLQLKVNGVNNTGGNACLAPNGFLSAGASDWLFVAVTYDSTIDPLVTSNAYFFAGDRFNPLVAGAGSVYVGATANSVAPASPNGPGYVNFSTNLNGDGSVNINVSNRVWVYIGNRSDRQRSFNGRYDDIRIYPNQILSQSDLDLVRQDAHLPAPQRLTFTQIPQNTTVAEGQGASFSVAVTPAPNITYQWYRFNPGSSVSNAIAGATNQLYETAQVTVASDNGAKYGVRVHSTDPFADFNGAGIYTNALLTVLPNTAYVATPGMLKFECFEGVTGTSVETFLGNPSANYTNNTPDLTLYLPAFDSLSAFPAGDSHQSYFVRISGWITPTVTTNYVFFIHAADQAQLYLSTDGGVSSNMLCQDLTSGMQAMNGPESLTSFAGGYFSAPVALTAGTSYPIYGFCKVGFNAGEVQVAWRPNSNISTPDLPANDANIADRLQPIPSAVLSTLALPGGTVSIGSSPANTSVAAGSKATFTAGVTTSYSTSNYLTGPTVIQWRKNGVNIPGATGASYTTPYLTPADTGSQFKAIVSIPGVSNATASATLTVTTDNVKPTVASATADDTGYGAIVQFSEPVDAPTALNPANYSIPGLTVVDARFATTTNIVDNPSYDAVHLTTTNVLADNTSYTVTVSNVKDRAVTQNTIGGTGNTATFRSMGLLAGVVKFEYFENQTYLTLIGGTVNEFVTLSPKFTNSDPDTVVFPTSAEMSPDGTALTRSAGGISLTQFPPQYGTRMSLIFTPPVTTNYVFYMAANETAILWLSTDENPANKHAIAWQSSSTSKRNWSANISARTSAFDTNLVGAAGVTVPGASPWPTADANSFATISLVAGQRYYLELDHIENAGWDSFDSVTYVTAADNATVVAPTFQSPTALTGSVIGWRFPLPEITSFSKTGNTASIAWTNNFDKINLGALGYPGLGDITWAFPSTALQTATVVTGPYTALTNTSPATVTATNPAQFFRIGEQ